MKPAPFAYSRAETVAEALSGFAAAEGEAKYLAGGQTLGPMLNLRLTQPDSLIDISRVAELREVEERSSSVILGAGIRHAEIEDGLVPDVARGLMRRTARGLAYRAVRNRGTIGGSLAHADPVAEWPNVLMALDATLLIRGVEGDRSVGVGDFFVGYLTTSLQPGEILYALEIPRLGIEQRTGISKLCRKVGEFAQSLAVTVTQGRRTARCVLGCAGGTPILLPQVGEIVPGIERWSAALRPEIQTALQADLQSAGVALDALELKTHAATVSRSIMKALAT